MGSPGSQLRSIYVGSSHAVPVEATLIPPGGKGPPLAARPETSARMGWMWPMSSGQQCPISRWALEPHWRTDIATVNSTSQPRTSETSGNTLSGFPPMLLQACDGRSLGADDFGGLGWRGFSGTSTGGDLRVPSSAGAFVARGGVWVGPQPAHFHVLRVAAEIIYFNSCAGHVGERGLKKAGALLERNVRRRG